MNDEQHIFLYEFTYFILQSLRSCNIKRSKFYVGEDLKGCTLYKLRMQNK